MLARANAITNQVFVVSVNCAGPTGQGRSIIVDPEGRVITEAPTAEPALVPSPPNWTCPPSNMSATTERRA